MHPFKKTWLQSGVWNEMELSLHSPALHRGLCFKQVLQLVSLIDCDQVVDKFIEFTIEHAW